MFKICLNGAQKSYKKLYAFLKFSLMCQVEMIMMFIMTIGTWPEVCKSYLMKSHDVISFIGVRK